MAPLGEFQNREAHFSDNLASIEDQSKGPLGKSFEGELGVGSV